jgi:hypothetical protein
VCRQGCVGRVCAQVIRQGEDWPGIGRGLVGVDGEIVVGRGGEGVSAGGRA